MTQLHSFGPTLFSFTTDELTGAVVYDPESMSPADWDEPSDDDWADYNEGSVYGYVVVDDQGNHLDSCWSIYGYDYAVSQAIEAVSWVTSELIDAGTYAI